MIRSDRRRHLRWVRLWCAVGIVLVLGAGVALAAEVGTRAAETQVRLETRSKGRVVITNSRRGTAVLRATRLTPGKKVSGTVRIGNRSRRTVVLRLKKRIQKQIVGPYGAKLAPRLWLRVVDVTRKKRPRVLFNGWLTKMKVRKIGAIRPGRFRRIRFIVRWPAKGRAAVRAERAMGSTVRVRFLWYATPRPRKVKVRTAAASTTRTAWSRPRPPALPAATPDAHSSPPTPLARLSSVQR
jgi:hypothetical protein